MTVERFSKEDFEMALTAIFKDVPWSCDGYRGRELRYHAVVKPGVSVEINSSIGSLGFADETGSNSIRIWLADENGKPLAKKEQAYITRVTGWQERMKRVIDMTLEHASSIMSAPMCPKCGGAMVERTRRSDGNKFYGCKKYPTCTGARDFQHDKGTIQNTVQMMNKQPLEQPIVQKKAFKPSSYQLAIFDWVSKRTGQYLVVEALAGSGKTTTGVEMLKLLPNAEEVVFVAFNKHIAVELSKRAPSNVKVSTYHSLGYSAVRQAFGNVNVDEDKVSRIIESILDKHVYKHVFSPIRQIVSLVKANMVDTTDADLNEIADHYGIELNGDTDMIFDAVRITIDKCAKMTGVIDYDDMCWMPIYLNLPMKQYDTLFVDEAQDTNKVQIALALKSVKDNGRIIAVGDRHQSLYGFRGADVNAIPNLIEVLGAEVLPLSITYRNPKLVVDLVNKEFPEIPLEAAEWAKPGTIMNVRSYQALEMYKPGDMVLCRTNAPLVIPAFALIRKGIKAVIRGRDIGKGLQVLVRKMKADTLIDLLSKANEYMLTEVGKLIAAEKYAQAQSLIDKVETIIALSDGISSITELEDRIEAIFSDDVEGVVFSSIHRSKGLEAENVFILRPDLLPHPMAKKEWEKIQENNIKYVAYTRTLDSLIFVEGE